MIFRTSGPLVALMLALSAQSLLAPAPAGAADDGVWPPITREARPWTRWWWHASAVNAADLSRLLERYAEAGLGGVEITPIYGVKGQEDRTVPYLSDQWIAVFRHVCAEAQRLGMGVDMPPGTGWRMGGPQVEPADSDARMAIEAIAVEPGQPFERPFPVGALQALMAFSEQGDPIDLMDQARDGVLQWQPPTGGPWTIYALSLRPSASRVKRPAPGGEGLSVNPFSRRALLTYLQTFDVLFEPDIPPAFRAWFHDSFEYVGNWSADFLDHFEQRRGYDLRRHLPALQGEGDPDQVGRIKSDYRQTLADLLLENFTVPWTEWCNERGMLSRNQAHGSPGNLLDLYGAVDIPETEIFRFDDHPLGLKFSSSAAHVLGLPLVSAESCTWLGEHFNVTLADARRALDGLFLSGINHIFYHGTTYSPDDAPWPGWLFYASTQFNHNNPIWRDVPALNGYVARVQAVLQAGAPDNDLLVYWPVFDLWADPQGMNQNYTVHNNQWITRGATGALTQRLWDQGHSFDFISDRQVLRLKAGQGGDIVAPGGAYRTVIVPTCRFLPAETLEALIALAEQGGTVIFQSPMAEDVPGWGELETRRERMAAVLGRVFGDGGAPDGSRTVTVGQGRVIVASDDMDAALAQVGARRETLFDDAGLRGVRRRLDDSALYAIFNRSDQAVNGWVPLTRPAQTVYLMDPMTGQSGRAASRPGDGGGVEVRMQIPAGETLLARLMNAPPTGDHPEWPYGQPDPSRALTLTGPWRMAHVAGGPTALDDRETSAPALWTRLDASEGQRFAGTVRYATTFVAPEGADQTVWRLDLGRVCDSARVFLNGDEVGTLIGPSMRMRLEGVREGENTLAVEVTSVAANRIRDMDRRGEPWKIFHDINMVNVDYRPLDASNWPVRDAGLAGPVTLAPMEK